jgi:hypothetical protein
MLEAVYTAEQVPPMLQGAQQPQGQPAQLMNTQGGAFGMVGASAGSEGEVQTRAAGGSPGRHFQMRHQMSVEGAGGGEGEAMDVLDSSTGSHMGLHQQVMHARGSPHQDLTRGDVVTHEDLANLMQ